MSFEPFFPYHNLNVIYLMDFSFQAIKIFPFISDWVFFSRKIIISQVSGVQCLYSFLFVLLNLWCAKWKHKHEIWLFFSIFFVCFFLHQQKRFYKKNILLIAFCSMFFSLFNLFSILVHFFSGNVWCENILIMNKFKSKPGFATYGSGWSWCKYLFLTFFPFTLI